MPKRFPADCNMPAFADHLGGTCVACGTVSTSLTVPTGATSALMRAAGADAYYNVNGTTAGSTSPGYIPSGQFGVVPPLTNFSNLAVNGYSAATIVYVEFYKD